MAFRRFTRKTRRKRQPKKLNEYQKEQVKKIVRKRQDWKYSKVNLVSSFGSVSTTPSGVNMTGTIVGSTLPTQLQRTGTDIELHNLTFKGLYQAGDQVNMLRVFLVLADTDDTGTIALSYNSDPNSRVYGQKFKVLADKMLVPHLDSAGNYLTYSLKFSHNFNKMILKYKDATGTANNETKKQLWLHMCSDSVAAAHPGFIQGYCTLWFKDYE